MRLYPSADTLADELLHKHGQNAEYPYLTLDRKRRIYAHEIAVDDIDVAIATFTTKGSFDRLRAREREYNRRAASAVQRVGVD